MFRKIVVILTCSLLPLAAMAQTEETLSAEDTLSAAASLYSDAPAIVFPGLEFGDKEFADYFDRRFETLKEVSKRPEFSYVPETGTPYTLLYSYGGYGSTIYSGSYGGAYYMFPSGSAFHWVAGRRDFDMLNFYTSANVYGGAGFQLMPGLEINAGGMVGASFLRDGRPVYQGGLQMSLVVRPSDNTSVMVWGQYIHMNALTPVPAAMPGSLQRMSVGASAQFKVGNATFGVGAEFSTY